MFLKEDYNCKIKSNTFLTVRCDKEKRKTGENIFLKNNPPAPPPPIHQ